MSARISRRGFFQSSAATVAAGSAASLLSFSESVEAESKRQRLHLGLVTYNLAKDWDVDTIIKNCTETKYEAVELRTTHAHKVEVELTPDQRAEVRKKFADSPVRLASLGSVFEFDSPDPDVLRKNIEGAKEYILLARDVGAAGIKMRPNRLHVKEGVAEETTLKQIGESLREIGEFGRNQSVEIRLEVHGSDTSRIPRAKKILDYADHNNVFVCWNSNQTDLDDGGLEKNFALLKDKIHFVHMRDLYLEEYPWSKMLQMLQKSGYSGYCCAEIPASSDPLRVMNYYRALFLAYQES